MGTSQVFPISNGALSRAQVFQWHGVALVFPARSRSGVRGDDGMIIFAMPAERVRVEAWGCSCLLWAREDGVGDQASGAERLEHCELAVRHGIAEGFLLGKDHAPAGDHELVALRVVRAREEYWAQWGFVVRAEPPRVRAPAMAAARSQ